MMKDNKELVILAGKGGSGGGGSGTDPNAVHYTADAGKSDSEKAAARTNIGAVSAAGAQEYINDNGLPALLPLVGDNDEGKVLTAYDDNSAGWAFHPYPQTVSGATPTITPLNDYRYNCGELTSLTITDPPATGEYSIVFTSGSTPTVTTFPATILGLEDFAAEANTLYEINVLDNRAVVGSWAVSSGE